MTSPHRAGAGAAFGQWAAATTLADSTVSSSEYRRAAMRSGPLYRLRDRIDDSTFRPDGRLVRSKRLARLEAVLLVAQSALTAARLAQFAGLVDAAEAQQLVELLNKGYDRGRSAFRIERTATGYLLMTRPGLVKWLDQLHQRQSQLKLSQPMMETLTIIAYQQPITRASVEAIRGVQSSEMIRQLIDRGLVKVGGEEDSLGRPFLYITTRQFLDMFGLGRLNDLPNYDAIGRGAQIEDPEQVLAESPAEAPNQQAREEESSNPDDDDAGSTTESAPEDRQAA